MSLHFPLLGPVSLAIVPVKHLSPKLNVEPRLFKAGTTSACLQTEWMRFTCCSCVCDHSADSTPIVPGPREHTTPRSSTFMVELDENIRRTTECLQRTHNIPTFQCLNHRNLHQSVEHILGPTHLFANVQVLPFQTP